MESQHDSFNMISNPEIRQQIVRIAEQVGAGFETSFTYGLLAAKWETAGDERDKVALQVAEEIGKHLH